jgi:hypothetical protein
MRKFNSGNGADVCDWCAAMLRDGGRVVKAHRELRSPGATLRYCGWRCMEEHVDSDAGMHRAWALMLAREAERLHLIAVAHPEGDTLTRMQNRLYSVEVKPG